MKKTIIGFLALYSSLALAADVSGVSPLFTYGNYQRFDEVTNLTPAVSEQEVELEETGRDGYLVQASRKIYASAGAAIAASEPMPVGDLYGWASVGLFPQFNTYANTTQSIKNIEGITPFKFKLPKNPEDFDSLTVGDSFYWNTKIGLTLNLSLGVSVVGVGPKVSIEGGHAVYVEKKSDTQVYIEILRLKTTSWGLLGGTYIGYAELSKAVSKAKGFSFLIDLSTENGKKAYEFLMHHKRLDLLQENASTADVKIGDMNSLQVLTSKKMALSTPFIPVLEFKRSKDIELVEESREDIWNNKSETVRAVSVKQRTTRILKKQSIFQTSALYQTQVSNGAFSEQAQLHWFKKGNRMTIKRLNKALKRLVKATGMKDEFSITLPEKASKKYAKVDLTVSLSPVLVMTLQKVFKLNTPKETVKYLQKSWDSKDNFQKMMKMIQTCGGSWKFEFAGQNFTRLIKERKFENKSTCVVSKAGF